MPVGPSSSNHEEPLQDPFADLPYFNNKLEFP